MDGLSKETVAMFGLLTAFTWVVGLQRKWPPVESTAMVDMYDRVTKLFALVCAFLGTITLILVAAGRL
jgi:hypothetical protein